VEQVLAALWGRGSTDRAPLHEWLRRCGFSDPERTCRRLIALRNLSADARAAEHCLDRLIGGLWGMPSPESALVNLERLLLQVSNPTQLLCELQHQPRGIEILVKLFVGSQYLSEILIRTPGTLQRLVQHRWLADLKSREEFELEALASAAGLESLSEELNALRRFQQGEILRIGASDAFALIDLRSATTQLSLLADALIRASLALVARDTHIATEDFCVLALGKLGGEELNYSSDIDLVFLSRTPQGPVLTLAQRLIRALQMSTSEGFLYRVDMRLRPWGRSGPLVSSPGSFLEYLQRHAEMWEQQALLKARIVAGDVELGRQVLSSIEPLIYGQPAVAVRESVLDSKARIERELQKQGKQWGEVKSGTGSLRDIEFLVQALQRVHGAEFKAIRSPNTLDGLVRLADFGLIRADEYRHLTGGYLFLRTVEHALQLMHNKQEHLLPRNPRELAYLAQRLDFPGEHEFVEHYEQHRLAIRSVFDRYLTHHAEQASAALLEPARGVSTRSAASPASTDVPLSESDLVNAAFEPTPCYATFCRHDEQKLHRAWLLKLTAHQPAYVLPEPLGDSQYRVTVLGVDHPGDLSVICGLLFVYGFDISEGVVSTGQHPEIASRLPRPRPPAGSARDDRPPRDFVNVFVVKSPWEVVPEAWVNYERDLLELLRLLRSSRDGDAQGRLAKRVAAMLEGSVDIGPSQLAAVEVEIDNASSPRATVLRIQSENIPGFLYELSNALALSNIDIEQVSIQTRGGLVHDTLHVVDALHGGKITDTIRQQELKAAVVLIKHFTHLIAKSPNPEAALLHFRSFLRELFQQPNWLDEISSLERPDTLDALAQLLGVSDFLWDDFLRLQYHNLFPLIRDQTTLQRPKSRAELDWELHTALLPTPRVPEAIEPLNAFKDREMFRVDMRHILGKIDQFEQFSVELTDVCEAVIDVAFRLILEELTARHGSPTDDLGRPVPVVVCALGKAGGCELGFASDIELMFLYANEGYTSGREPISNAVFLQRAAERFTQVIRARREGIFQIDLRLRPYGRAGNLGVSTTAFESYYGPDGAAWPFERQSLIKLRPIAGDLDFGQQVVELRDRLIYRPRSLDVTAMRGMRERQVRQHVKPGTFHAKLSPGGLVDAEYLIQGLQLLHGHRDATVRLPNTTAAAQALCHSGWLSAEHLATWRAAYVLLRRLIDGLRMVRGDARDLTVPDVSSEEFEFLARRLGYGQHVQQLHAKVEAAAEQICELLRQCLPTASASDPALSASPVV
jgi:[glutamine synthetase] adenylyltransferase / [glutamine synthetase]-adenylyl-L-tyrosine phosphorylase